MKIECFMSSRDADKHSVYPYRKYGFNSWFWVPYFRRGILPTYYKWFVVSWLCFGIELQLDVSENQNENK